MHVVNVEYAAKSKERVEIGKRAAIYRISSAIR